MSAGIAVLGAAGGCGTTTVAAALAHCAPAGQLRVLALDGHGGGPHRTWGLAPERTVDDLRPVRHEVDASHVERILHRRGDGHEVIVGPADGIGMAAWADGDAERLVAACIPAFAWVADLGRGDHAVGRAVVARAAGVAIVSPCTVAAAGVVHEIVGAVPTSHTAVIVSQGPGGDCISPRAFRRLVGGSEVVDMSWHASQGRRGRRALSAVALRVWEILGAP